MKGKLRVNHDTYPPTQNYKMLVIRSTLQLKASIHTYLIIITNNCIQLFPISCHVEAGHILGVYEMHLNSYNFFFVK